MMERYIKILILHLNDFRPKESNEVAVKLKEDVGSKIFYTRSKINKAHKTVDNKSNETYFILLYF